MPKKIITHINPDSDAATSVWLLKRFLPGWEEAEVGFVEATANGEKVNGVDEDPDVLYVDVGRGKLDHHQTGKLISASELCWKYLLEQRTGQPLGELTKAALEELVATITQIDNARDINWPEVKYPRYYFYLHNLLDALRGLGESDQQVLEFAFRALDGILLNLKNKLEAEKELKKGIEFKTAWGRAIGLESKNKQIIWQGQILGYALVIKKDPQTGGVQIYSRSDFKVDLTKAYNKVRKMDPNSDWFLHATKKLLLNQGSVNPNMRPTKLSLKQLIAVIKREEVQ
jgi:hypothetical protein